MLRKSLFTGSMIGLVAGLCAPSAALAMQARKFAIPAQPASSAIPFFARHANLQILVSAEILRGVRTSSVVGTLPPRVALEQLLHGTGLRIVSWEGNVVTLARGGDVPPDQGRVAAAQDSETIVVTGFTRSVSAARTLKRKSDTIRDVIVAEDMAKFPELNLAESLQRVPGVAINREAGEGRRVTLRGLGPDFTRVQLNGMEVLGNVDSAMDSRGQRSRDRAFDFNIFASELFSKVEVEKTYQAAQNEGGMAGTIGLFTAKPLDNKPGFKGVLSAKAGSNSYSKDFQPRLAAMLGYNHDDRLGALVSVAWSRRKTQEQGYDTYNPVQPTAAQMRTYLNNGVDISGLDAATRAKFLSGDLVFASGNRLSVWDAKQERLGVTLAAQWQPSDRLKFTLDGLYGRFRTDRDEYHLANRPTGSEIIFNGAYTDYGKPIAASKINALRWDASNFVTFADVDNATYGSEHRRQINKNRFRQIALTGAWKPSDALSFDGHVGYEKSTYETPIDDKLYLQAQGGMVTSYAADGGSAHNAYKWDTSDASKYSIRELYFRENGQDTSLTEGVLNARYQLDPVFRLSSGYAYRRYATDAWDQFNDGLYAAEFRSKPGYDAAAPFAVVYDGHKDQDFVVGDWDRMFAYYGKSHTMVGPTSRTLNTFDIAETTHAGYLQLNWSGALGGLGFRGNLGGRAYRTNVVNNGLVANAAGTRVPTTVKTDYSGVLPALNATLELTPSLQIRLAAAQNINRPALASMKLTGSVTGNNGAYTISNGNPDLKPYKSTDLDLAAEWYFGRIGMVSMGVFHKDIKDLITTVTLRDVPFSVTGLPTSLAPGLTPDTNIAQFTQSLNLARARLTGLEIAAQTDFAFLPAPFDGIGVLGNLTLIDSNSRENGRDGPITGLSDVNANGTLYYENKRWGIRGSANYRSGYLRQRYDGVSAISQDGFKDTVYVDAAAFVNVARGMRLTLDAINLTNQPEVQINSIYDRLHNVTRSGTTVFLGMNLSF